MNRTVGATEVVPDVVYLGMTVMTASNTVVCTGLYDLIVFDLTVSATLLGKTRL